VIIKVQTPSNLQLWVKQGSSSSNIWRKLGVFSKGFFLWADVFYAFLTIGL